MSKKHYFFTTLVIILISSFAYAATIGETVANQSPSYESSVCGNGIIENSEECEEDNLNKKTCESYGFMVGTLSCKGCVLDTSECIGPSAPAAQFVEAPGVKLSPVRLIVIVALIVIVIGGVIYYRKIN